MINLYSAGKKGVFEVVSMPGIAQLANLGLRVGTQVAVKGRYALGGPVLLRVNDDFTLAVGKDIATQIAVKEVRCHESPQCPSRCPGVK
ncbi:MAG: ferrous iron transport protein A [Clostridiales bacterium]|jgi:Fe2+ transport system protein FeoA|nr:ferrous iron transport protein A [Clostridiales bacterium]